VSARNWTQFRTGVDDLVRASRLPIVTDVSLPEIVQPRKLLASSTADEAEATSQHGVLPPASGDSKDPLAYIEAAVALLRRAHEAGESWITINFEEKTYCLGRSPDGYGTPYPIDSYLALDELIGAIERRFSFLGFGG
jgi:hypothetical protein